MSVVAILLTVVVALLHAYILYLEMFAWESTRTRKIFGTSQEFAKMTTALAANQGLYNGFLSAGLFWGVFAGKTDVVVFFLFCICVAAIYGARTVSQKILFTQGLPAALALFAVVFLN
jgi:putative membrane protein